MIKIFRTGRYSKKGMALIELLIAVAIAMVIVGVIVLTLDTGFEIYRATQDEAILQKALDDSLDQIINGDFENPGIKDALEITDISQNSISYVPMWIADEHQTRFEHAIPDLLSDYPFILAHPVKLGAFVPVAEVFTSRKTIMQVPVTLIQKEGVEDEPGETHVVLNIPVEPNRKIRFLYFPHTDGPSEAVTKILSHGGGISRQYRGVEERIPRQLFAAVEFSDFKFQYFDNTNTEVEPSKKLISSITAVKVTMTASLNDMVRGEKHVRASRTGSLFACIRNSRAMGVGLMIRKGTEIKIPDSKSVRTFSLANISGAKDGGKIVLDAVPKAGKTWRITVEMKRMQRDIVIHRYGIDYPVGKRVYSEVVNLTTDLALNFLTLGADGQFDYDFDKGMKNAVGLEGDVTLKVVAMDAEGATIYIRP